MLGMNETNTSLSVTNSSLDIWSSQFDPSVMKFRAFIHFLNIYVQPVIALFGILGNVTSFAVFMFTYMRHISSSIYLAALSISDTGFLLFLLVSWSDHINLNIIHRQGMCQLFVYVTYVSSFLSVWYIVCFTAERYLVIKFPLKRQELCTSKKAKIVTLSLTALAFLLYTFAFWTTNVIHAYGGPFCSPMPRYYSLVSTLGNVDTAITLVIPTILIVGGNIQIGYVLAKFYRTRRQLGQRTARLSSRNKKDRSRASASQSVSSSTTYDDTSYNRSQMKVTRMLLIISTVFVFCNIPSHTIRMWDFTMSQLYDDYQSSHMFKLIHKFCLFLYNLNFSVNFILYAISGKTFRQALSRLCGRIRRSLVAYFRNAGSSMPFVRRKSAKSRNGDDAEVDDQIINQQVDIAHQWNAIGGEIHTI